MLCPMILDEIGFLSEWTAYHEMQGFDHIIFYDVNSTTSLSELDPWLKSGFAEIRREWWNEADILLELYETNIANISQFVAVTKIKEMSERQCKQQALDWGYELFVSIDLDEYLVPSSHTQTVMDELVSWFNQTTRGFVMLDKYQFTPSPHYVEPVNMLTIEAYQMRLALPGKLNYYKTVGENWDRFSTFLPADFHELLFFTAPKLAIRLQGGQDYTFNTSQFLVTCCTFHGCGDQRPECVEMKTIGSLKSKFSSFANII